MATVRITILTAYALFVIVLAWVCGNTIWQGWRLTCDNMRERYEPALCRPIPGALETGCCLVWHEDGTRSVIWIGD